MGLMFEVICLIQMSLKPRIFIIQDAAVYITRILSIFGLCDAGGGDIGFGSSASQGVASAASLEVVVVCNKPCKIECILLYITFVLWIHPSEPDAGALHIVDMPLLLA
jgi:hypothetical protein